MQTIEQYFEHPDAPSAGSSAGLAMVELLKLKPSLHFDEARSLVKEIGASLYAPKECAKAALRLIEKSQTAAA